MIVFSIVLPLLTVVCLVAGLVADYAFKRPRLSAVLLTIAVGVSTAALYDDQGDLSRWWFYGGLLAYGLWAWVTGERFQKAASRRSDYLPDADDHADVEDMFGALLQTGHSVQESADFLIRVGREGL